MFSSRTKVVGVASRSREQALALLMARHRRLGARSPASRLSPTLVRIIMAFLSEGSVATLGCYGMTAESRQVFVRTRGMSASEPAPSCTGLALGFFSCPLLLPHSYLIQFSFLGTASFGFGLTPSQAECSAFQSRPGWLACTANSFCYACNGLTARDGVWNFEEKHPPLRSGTVISLCLRPSKEKGPRFDVFMRQDAVALPVAPSLPRDDDADPTAGIFAAHRRLDALKGAASNLDPMSMKRVARGVPAPLFFGVCAMEVGAVVGLHRCVQF